MDRRDLALQNREDAANERENALLDKQKEIQEKEAQMEEIKKEQMINRIKTIIENNETEDMKTYGYEIIVDSTIPELKV